MFRHQSTEGFTLIEILMVVAIIGILTAISVPSYIGMQERGRIGSIQRVSGSYFPELQGWIHAVRKGGSALGTLIEVDTNGDGFIAAPDLNNNTLASTGVVTAFVASKTDMSPWNSTSPLWNNGNVANGQAACDAVALANTGQITLCYSPAENQSIGRIFLSASSGKGELIFQKAISAD